MRLDPRKACDSVKDSFFWAFVHDVIAHPFSALTLYSSPSVRFHNWTSEKAWPRKKSAFVPAPDVIIPLPHLPHLPGGVKFMKVSQLSPDVWEISHPRVNHQLRTSAKDQKEATEKAVKWFCELSREFGGRFDMFN